MFRLSSRHTRLAVAAAGALALAACGQDSRIKELSAGITRDSTLRIIGQGAKDDSGLANVYRQEEYLKDGHMLEVLFFAPKGEKEGRDSVEAKRLTPLVLQDGLLATWNWAGYDSVAMANSLQQDIKRSK